jgi:hypothetical protein
MEPELSGQSLTAQWRERLERVDPTYSSERTAETRAEYRRILRIFSDLVIYGIQPRRGIELDTREHFRHP